jgi:hypothetical protein
MTFHDALHLLGMDVTFGAFTPLEEMTSPLFFPLHSHVWTFERTFLMY